MKRSALLPIAVVAALPFRVPVSIGDHSANLLLPLYIVIAAGLIAKLLAGRKPDVLRTSSAARPESFSSRIRLGRAASEEDVRRRPSTLLITALRHRPDRALTALLVASVLLYAIQSTYSADFEEAAKILGFFLIPFALMFWLLLGVRWTPRLMTTVFAVAIAEMLVLALIGIIQHETRLLFWNDEVIASNEFQRYFRVNSLFWDPNIFGRYLAVVVIAATAALLWAQDRRRAVLLTAVVAVLWGALALTYSQSSFAALVAGLVILAAVRWSVRWTALASGVAVAAGLVYLLAFGSSIKFSLDSERGLDRATSGRADLVVGGIELASRRPVWGFGSGSFVQSFREESKEHVDVAASHTEPITVAAEQGAIGLAVYVALIVCAFAVLARGLGGAGPNVAARAGLLACFAALFIHTMAYDAFLSDPISWLLLALGVALARPAPAAGR